MTRRLGAILQIYLWSLRDYLREPAALFWTLGFPILMTLAFGQVTGRPKELRATVAVVASPAEQERAARWIADEPLGSAVHFVNVPENELARALATGKVRLAVERPWEPTTRRWRFDPSNQEALSVYHELRDRLDQRPSDIDPVAVTGGRYIDFVLPGLLALGIVNSCLWAVGLGLVELREKRVLRLMLATPLRPRTFFGGMFLARLTLSTVEAGTLLAASSLLFGVHVLGSVWALAGLWLCGLVAFFGLAVLLGSRTDRPSIGQGLINAATLPMFLVSGIFFSLDNFPPALASVFRAFPPTLLVDGTRAVMGGGGGWPEVALPCLVLLATGAACFAVGKRIFRFH